MDDRHLRERLPLRGLELRALLVVLLLDVGRPVPLAYVVDRIRRSGWDFEGRPSKAVSDALRWEVARGRVVRLGRGVYGPGVVAKVTRHRMRERVAAMRNHQTAPAGARRGGVSVRADGGFGRLALASTAEDEAVGGRSAARIRPLACLCAREPSSFVRRGRGVDGPGMVAKVTSTACESVSL